MVELPEKKTKPWGTLPFQLFFLIILPLTPLLLVITFGSIELHQRAMRTMVGERDERSARTAALAIGDQLDFRLNTVRGLAIGGAAAAQGEDLQNLLSTSEYLLSSFDAGLAFFAQDGALLAASGGEGLWEALPASVVHQVTSLPANEQRILTQAFSQPAGAAPVALALAASPDGQLVAAGAFRIDSLARHILSGTLASGHQAYVILLDSDGRVLYQNGELPSQGDWKTHPGVPEALNGESGTRYMGKGNDEHVVAFSPVAATRWVLLIEEPWRMVVSPILLTTQVAPLVLVPVLLLALLALLFGVRQVVKPLQALEGQAAGVAWGDYRAIEKPVGGIAEIRRLQAELIHMARKVQAAQRSLHGYIGSITAAQEEERRRLARELHDDTIQSLIALKQRVQLAHFSQPDERLDRSLVELEDLTEKTIDNLRRVTRALRPIYLEDLGLVTALEMLARETGATMNIPVEFRRKGEERRLAPAVELALYRMAQEALSNVARHAKAERASVSLGFSPQAVTLEVRDNGRGFEVPPNPAGFTQGGHYGLLGLHERAELIGADLKIESTPGQGTCLSVHLVGE